jgi:SRSO17 transposase
MVEEERRHRKSGVLSPVSPELIADVIRRASEALRLINVILGRAAGGEEMEEGEEAA